MSTWNADIETNNVTGLAANRSRKSGRSHLDLELVDTLLELNSQIGLPRLFSYRTYISLEILLLQDQKSRASQNRGRRRAVARLVTV